MKKWVKIVWIIVSVSSELVRSENLVIKTMKEENIEEEKWRLAFWDRHQNQFTNLRMVAYSVRLLP